jgi:hypothetical protein
MVLFLIDKNILPWWFPIMSPEKFILSLAQNAIHTPDFRCFRCNLYSFCVASNPWWVKLQKMACDVEKMTISGKCSVFENYNYPYLWGFYCGGGVSISARDLQATTWY